MAIRRKNALRSALLTAFAAAVLSGCEGPSGAVDSGISYDPNSPGGRIEQLLATDAPQYTRGGPARVRLVNRTGRSVGYNLCRSRLERQDDGNVWRPMTEALAEACTAELRTLAPGQAIAYTFRIAPRARPGRYRISTDLQDLSARLRFIGVSNVFSVEGTD